MENAPRTLLQAYHHAYGDQLPETARDFDSFARSIVLRARPRQLESMATRLYSEIYSERMDRDQFDERVGMVAWRDAQPSWLEVVGSRMAQRGADLTAGLMTTIDTAAEWLEKKVPLGTLDLENFQHIPPPAPEREAGGAEPAPEREDRPGFWDVLGGESYNPLREATRGDLPGAMEGFGQPGEPSGDQAALDQRRRELQDRNLIRSSEKFLRELDLDHEPRVTWEEVKKSPADTFIAFALEEFLVSLPDMVSAVTALPAYVAARTGVSGQERAENDLRDDATIEDLLIALPFEASAALLERFAARRLFGVTDQVKDRSLKEIGKAVGRRTRTEGLTEAVQEPIQQTGANIGTERWKDKSAGEIAAELAETSAAGALAGGVGGGTVAIGTAPLQAPASPREQAADEISQAAREELNRRRPPPTSAPAPESAMPAEPAPDAGERAVQATERVDENIADLEERISEFESRSMESLVLEEEAKLGKRRAIEPTGLTVGDRVLVDSGAGPAEIGTVIDASARLVRIADEQGSPIAVIRPDALTGEEPRLYNVPPPEQREGPEAEAEVKRTAFAEEAGRLIERVVKNPEDRTALEQLIKSRNNPAFQLLDAANRSKIDDLVEQRRQEAETAEAEEAAAAEAEKKKQTEAAEAEKRRQAETKDLDERLKFNRKREDARADAVTLAGDEFAASVDADVRAEMGVAATAELAPERRQTYLSLYQTQVDRERRRQKAEESDEAVAPPEPAQVSEVEFSAYTEALPADADGNPDYERGAAVIADVAGAPTPWGDLTTDQQRAVIERLGAETALPEGGEGDVAAPETPSSAPVEREGGEGDVVPSSPPASEPEPEPEPIALEPAEPGRVPEGELGQEREVITAAGRRVEVRPELVEAADLIASHDATGTVNPTFPQDLQPRDRTRAASQTQISKMAADLTPELLMPAPQSAEGAPIIGPDNVVESGNARTIAIREAYERNPESAQRYREYLEGKGYDVAGMDRPVLVQRRTQDMSPEDRQAFTREANQRTTAERGASEVAAADAEALMPKVLAAHRGGDLRQAANRDFVRAFIDQIVPESERGGMLTAAGELSQASLQRVENAVFAKAYGDAELLARLREDQESTIKSIGDAMIEIAPTWAAMREAARAGQIDAALDTTPNLVEAVRLVERARREKRTVAEFVNQTDMFGAEGGIDPTTESYLRLLFKNQAAWVGQKRKDRISLALQTYAEEAMKGAAGADMFGHTVSAEELLAVAEDKQGEEEARRAQQEDLLAQARARVALHVEEETKRIANDPELIEEIRRIAMAIAPDVTVYLEPETIRTAHGRAMGVFAAGNKYMEAMIQVALRGDPKKTLRHEVLHALKDAGLFTDAEWSALLRAADRGKWLRKHKIWERYPDLHENRDPNRPTEEAFEEAIADEFATWARDGETAATKRSAAVRRMFERIYEFFRQITMQLRMHGMTPETDNVFDEFTSVFEAIETGEVRGRQKPEAGTEQEGRTREARPDPASAGVEFHDPETEQRWTEAAEGVKVEGVISKIGSAVGQEWARLTRHYEHMPETGHFSDAREKMLHLEQANHVAKEEIAATFKRVMGDLDGGDIDLLTRKMVLDDLLWSSQQGMDLPFGLKDTNQVLDALKDVEAVLAARPDLQQRLVYRTEARVKLRDALVSEGVLTEKQARNPHYFRHQVLEYASLRERAARGRAGKVKSTYWHPRRGSEKDINANFFQAESDWMFKAYQDIATAKFLNWIRTSKYNTRAGMVAQAKAQNEKGFRDLLVAEMGGGPAYADAKTATQVAQIVSAAMKAGDRDVKKRLEKAPNMRAFREARQKVVVSMATLRKAIDADPDALSDMPKALRKQLENLTQGLGNSGLQDTGQRAPVWGALRWLADSDIEGINRLSVQVLGAVGARSRVAQKALGEAWVNPQDTAGLIKAYGDPDATSTWQPDAFDGKQRKVHIFTGKTVTEHVLDRALDKLDAIAGDTLTQEQVDQIRAMLTRTSEIQMLGGPMEELVLPNEIAETLNDFYDQGATSMIDELAITVTSRWKQWTLFNPARFSKYFLNNMTGDIDALLATRAGTGVAKHLPQAWRDMRAVIFQGERPSDTAREALERGVIQSSLVMQEITGMSTEMRYEAFRMARTKGPLKWGKKYFDLVQNVAALRENAFRLAAYYHYKEQFASGKSLLEIGYGASPPWMVEGITDQNDKAARMARDLLGDYGAIPYRAQWARTRLLPFVSWIASNTTRYKNLFRNAYLMGRDTSSARGLAMGAYTGGGLLVRMFLFYGAVQVWNNLLFGDDEEELDAASRFRMHLNLGRWGGEIVQVRFQGALSDFAGWFGFEDAGALMAEVVRGRASPGDVVKELAGAPVNKIVQAVSPLYKLPMEFAINQQFFPDVWNPRSIRDRERHAARTFSLDYPVATLKKLFGEAAPTYPLEKSITGVLLTRRDPGQMAYNTIRGKAFRFIEDETGSSIGGRSGEKSMALYNLRLARKRGDTWSERLAREKLESFPRSGRSRRASDKRAAPLGMFPNARLRRKFLQTLTERERAQLKRATNWYNVEGRH